MTHSYSLHQHIHAGYWFDGRWTSYRYTFATPRGFNDWSRAKQRRGCAVQWRWCGEDDAMPAPWVCATSRKARAA
jgi:hypothetical protein